MAKYYTLVTDVGRAKMANAQVMGEKVSFSQIALGSSETKPRENQTALGKEEWRGPISNVSLDKDNPNWIVVEAVVPSHVGGFEIAEVGVYDEEGHLIVVGNHPKTYKPKMDEGTTKDVAIRIIIEVSNSEIVELKVDPSVVIATREYVESAIELAMASIDFSTIEKQIDQHVSNADIHVTAQDKKNWNAKETPSAAQQKATKALNEAKLYIDKHSNRTDNPHKVTKSQVGLSNVDNVKQASKIDLDNHIGDAVKHITASERASWNAKETPAGAQAKATKALKDANIYTDTHSNRTDNPHKVTKSQIGLGKVANYEVATKAEAEAGTSNNTYMTPLRVLESLIANAGDVLDDIVVMDEHLPSDAGIEDFPKGVSVGYTSVLGDNYPQRWGTLINFRSKSDLVMAQLWFGNGGGTGTTRHKLYYRIYNSGRDDLENGWTKWYKVIDVLDKSDSTTSNSSETIATSKAIKDTMDAAKAAQKRADEAFQLGVKQKRATADSLTSIGASLQSDPTWDRLQSEIKKADYVREAEVTISAGQTTVTLDFYPTAVSGRSYLFSENNYYCINHSRFSHRVFREGQSQSVADLEFVGKTIKLEKPLPSKIYLHVTGVLKK